MVHGKASRQASNISPLKSTYNDTLKLIPLDIEKAKQLGHLKGIYKATPKKEKVKHLLKRNITDVIVLENQDIFHPYGIALLRYRNPHLIVNNFETYPIGIFSELTKYDIRDENYELAYGLNSENVKHIKSSAIPEKIWEEFE